MVIGLVVVVVVVVGEGRHNSEWMVDSNSITIHVERRLLQPRSQSLQHERVRRD